MKYKDLTIEQFQKITEAVNSMESNPVNESMAILSIMTGTSIDKYKKMSITNFTKECDKLDWMKDSTMPDKYVLDFNVDSEPFEIVQNATDWNVEQFISMTNLTKSKDDIIPNLHLIMATLTKGCDTITEHKRRSELFQKHLTLEIAYPTAFFFAQFLTLLSKTTQFSLLKKKMKKRKAKLIGLT